MKLTDIPPIIGVYGDTSFRGKCPTENIEQVSIINRIRREYPDTWGLLIIHPRNEQQLRGGQFSGMIKQKAEGLTPGASDVIIPVAPSLVMELKRRDHTQSKWEDGQIPYLEAAGNAGAFACVALGAVAAYEAFQAWLTCLK